MPSWRVSASAKRCSTRSNSSLLSRLTLRAWDTCRRARTPAPRPTSDHKKSGLTAETPYRLAHDPRGAVVRMHHGVPGDGADQRADQPPAAGRAHDVLDHLTSPRPQ